MANDKAERIRDLNDAFRKTLSGGRLVCTAGVNAEGPEFVLRATRAVQYFDDFNEANDPHGEHDFGSFHIDDQKLFWKIDYYADARLELGSEDPADPAQTYRVLTIMLAHEY